MSWSEGLTRRGLLAVLAALPACGFVPAFGPGGGAGRFAGQTALVLPRSVLGYRILSRLEARLGTAGAETWRLEVTATAEEVPAAVSIEGDITRRNLLGIAEWRLIETATGATVASGVVREFTGWSATDSTVATRAAAIAAEERLAVLLADGIVTAILALPA